VVKSQQDIINPFQLVSEEHAEKGLNLSESCFKITEVEFYRGSSPLSFDLDRKTDSPQEKFGREASEGECTQM